MLPATLNPVTVAVTLAGTTALSSTLPLTVTPLGVTALSAGSKKSPEDPIRAATATWLTCPSLLCTVHVMAGTWPTKLLLAGVNVTLPFDRTTTVPAVWLLTGSTTVTAVGPAGYTVAEPGSTKPVTLALAPGGGVVPPSTLTATLLLLPAAAAGDWLLAMSGGTTLSVSATSTDCPSVLATETTTDGTTPRYAGSGVNVKVPLGWTSSVPATALVPGTTTLVGPPPGVTDELEPGSLKPETVRVLPGGEVALASTLPVAGWPMTVVMLVGSTTSATAAGPGTAQRGHTIERPQARRH